MKSNIVETCLRRTKSFCLPILILIFFVGCTQHKPVTPKTNIPVNFTTFEISYHSGWIGSLSFLIDSEKVYFFRPQLTIDSKILYGVIPDSIFHRIDSLILRIKNDTSLQRNKDRGCIDCSEMAAKIISKNDTLRIHQQGPFDPEYNALLNIIQSFLEHRNHKSINCLEFWETNLVGISRPTRRFLEREMRKSD